MQIDELKTYKTGFKTLGVFSLMITGLSFILLAGVCIFFYKQTLVGFESIYIVDPKSHSIVKADQALNSANPEREFEYKNQVDLFYHNWYEFDQFTFKAHVEKGVNYLGNCGKSMLNDYKAQDFGRKLIEKNLKCTVSIDSILIDINHTPVRGACFAIQKIESPAGVVNRKLHATFTIHDLESRSLENPHGCLIDDFKIFDQEIIEQEQE